MSVDFREGGAWLVVDLDCLCDYAHRIDYRNAGEWEEFHSRLADDKVNLDVADFINFMQASHINVAVFTGRPLKWHHQTLAWLHKYDVAPDELWMRSGDDWDKDAEMKIGMLEKFFGSKSEALDSVWAVLDTKEKSIAALRNYGFTVWQPRAGNY